MRGFGWRTACLVAVALSLGGAAACAADSVPSAPRVAGAHAGLWSWDLPDTPNGTVPKQSWSGPGAASAGEIFVGDELPRRFVRDGRQRPAVALDQAGEDGVADAGGTHARSIGREIR